MTMTRGRGFWKWSLLTLALTGCGGVLGDEAEDETLLTLEGSLRASESFEAGSSAQMRAALLWQTWPQAVVDCMVQSPLRDALSKCQRVSPRSSFHHPDVDVQVNGRFPNSFTMSLNRLPGPEGLMGGAGSRLGLASVVAYVDGNGNRTLDRVDSEATTSVDIVVGHQEGVQLNAMKMATIVYREGALHPLYTKLFSDCPVVPQGYSVVEYRYHPDPSNPDGDPIYDGCFLMTRKVDVDIILEANQAFQRLACHQANQLFLADMVRATTASLPPAGSSQVCRTYMHTVSGSEQVLVVNLHPERFCTTPNQVVYSLRDYWNGTWDDRAAPPAWWPCTVTAP
ncbi:hypothetical protein HUW62_38205 [Myxococcus sp. AM011]|uniref:hypothetical protein n=1 Tax=Myxococcus sp. AM011 TaxID=2745200 RepID=UPI0015958FCD|nr:hypothetical protein [Myxococcus sp. AM011]NVJ27066.1 hypothetical protein [Myxococcus sp. AM011]